MGIFISVILINSPVVKLTPSGKQTTFFSGLSEPIGLAADAAGDVFIADAKKAAYSKCRHLVNRQPSLRVYRSLRASRLMAQATCLSPIRGMARCSR